MPETKENVGRNAPLFDDNTRAAALGPITASGTPEEITVLPSISKSRPPYAVTVANRHATAMAYFKLAAAGAAARLPILPGEFKTFGIGPTPPAALYWDAETGGIIDVFFHYHVT